MLDSVGIIGGIGRTRHGARRLGPELLLNGSYSTDTGWTKGGGWTIAGGVAVRVPDAGQTAISQGSLTLVVGAPYLVAFDIVTQTAGNIQARLSGGTNVSGASVNNVNRYEQTLTAVTGNNSFNFLASTSANLTVDNVSLRRILL